MWNLLAKTGCRKADVPCVIEWDTMHALHLLLGQLMTFWIKKKKWGPEFHFEADWGGGGKGCSMTRENCCCVTTQCPFFEWTKQDLSPTFVPTSKLLPHDNCAMRLCHSLSFDAHNNPRFHTFSVHLPKLGMCWWPGPMQCLTGSLLMTQQTCVARCWLQWHCCFIDMHCHDTSQLSVRLTKCEDVHVDGHIHFHMNSKRFSMTLQTCAIIFVIVTDGCHLIACFQCLHFLTFLLAFLQEFPWSWMTAARTAVFCHASSADIWFLFS